MTTAVSDILERASTLLFDTGEVKWTDDELNNWLNDAAREIISRVNDANIVTANFTLAWGVNQTPITQATGVRIIEIPRNAPPDGAAIRVIDKKTLNAAKPSWPDDTPAATVKNVMFDRDDPLSFDVYPPNNGAGSVQITYQAHAAAFAVGGNWPINSVYTNAALDYVLYRAYNKETDYGDPARAEYYHNKFLQAVGANQSGDAAADAVKNA